MRKILRVFKFIAVTLLFLILFVNISYWGLIIVGGLIGIWAYVVIGIILLFLIAGYIGAFRSLVKESSVPKVKEQFR